MHNGDTLYIGNANANEFLKFTGYLSAITGIMSAISGNAATVIHAGP